MASTRAPMESHGMCELSPQLEFRERQAKSTTNDDSVTIAKRVCSYWLDSHKAIRCCAHNYINVDWLRGARSQNGDPCLAAT